LAVMTEAGEPEWVPGAAALEDRRHVPEYLVPAPALLEMPRKLRVDAPWVDLFFGVWRSERVDRRQVSPLPVLLLQQLLERFEIVLGNEVHVVGVLIGRRRMRALEFLCPGVDPLHLRRRGADDHPRDPQALVERRHLFGRNVGAEVDPLLLVRTGGAAHPRAAPPPRLSPPPGGRRRERGDPRRWRRRARRNRQ